MAHAIFDALTGVSLDSSSVQSIFESPTLIDEIDQLAIDQDEDDIFQCGKCKSQFTSLNLFVLHKRDHRKVPQQMVDFSQYLSNNNSHIAHRDSDGQENGDCTPDYSVDDDFGGSQLDGTIILQENDILFSIDQDANNFLTTDTDPSFDVPIILSNERLESFADSSITGSNDEPLSDKINELPILENEIKPKTNNNKAQETNDFDDTKESIFPIVANSNNNIINNNNNETDKTEIVDKTIETEQENKPGPSRNLKYKCSYCQKQFAKKFYWQQHERSHTGEKPYQCVVCGRPFAQKSNVKKHMSSHKVWPGTAIHSLPPEAPIDGSIERSYHCQFCKEIFDSYKALKGHLILTHLTLKVYKCVQNGCGSMFAELEDFLEHTRSHQRSEYRCHICGETFSTLNDLGVHQHTHSIHKQKSTEKYYCCTVCKSSFSNLEALQNHMETTTHDYVCPHCGKSFLIERFLRRHLKTHASMARFACDDCGKAFKTEQYLANHKVIHSEETPFSCPNCPARFKRKDRLGRHMLIHDLSKRLKCPFRNHNGCMSEFSRPDKLKRHLLTHSNVKRFSCITCNRHFHRSQALKHHELRKHSVKCDSCLHTFKTSDQLITHNCESAELKKHITTQLPKKASGSFKPRRPTPKRQIPSKTTTTPNANTTTTSTSSPDKDIIKTPEPIKKTSTEEPMIAVKASDLDSLDLEFDISNDGSLLIDFP